MSTSSYAVGSSDRADQKLGTRELSIACFDPSTRERLGDVPVQTPAEVRERVARARRAGNAWAKTSFRERRKVLGLILDHVIEHADELVEVVVRDAGKTRENAMLGEVWTVCEKLRHVMAHGEEALRPDHRPAGLFMHKRARVEYLPLGVIGVICPWNYPMQNILGPAIPALFAGNGVVIKVSEYVAWSSARFQRIFDEALDAAGFSKDLVQIVNGYADTGAALVSSGVDKIIFTGSMANGRKVITESAKNLTPLILELGGKDAFIVCDDANIEQAAHGAMAGTFIAAGQNCLAAERYFVFDKVYDEFLDQVVSLVRDLRQGPPLGKETVDVGAMTSPQQIDIVERLVNDAVSKGARVLVGGKRNHPDMGDYFAPTVLVDVKPGMAILEEETFGPVMVIMKVDGEDEAIRRANETQYGLSATVMTRSQSRGERMAKEIIAGGTSINDFGLTYMAMDLPFGGVRGSGFGRLNGEEGLRACCNAKSVLSDKLPFGAPAKLYPVGAFDYDIAKGVIKTLYTRGLTGKARAASALARTAWKKFSGR